MAAFGMVMKDANTKSFQKSKRNGG